MKREAFEALWEGGLKRELESLEGLRLKERRAIIWGFVSFCIGFVLTWIILGSFKSFDPALGVFAGCAFGYGSYYLLRPKHYRAKYKELVITALVRQTTYRWEHEKKQLSHEHYDQLFRESGLFRLSQCSVTSDDVFHSKTTPLRCAELFVTTGTGKRKRDVFNGLLFVFDLSRPFSGETYIRKEVFGADYVGTRSGANSLRETTLEWNEFGKLLKVETTNEVEAREILDPRFMAILYDWWRSHKASIRLGFHGNQLYLSAGFGRDLFEPKAFSSIERHKEELWEYLDAFLLVERLFDHVEHKYRLTKKLEV